MISGTGSHVIDVFDYEGDEPIGEIFYGVTGHPGGSSAASHAATAEAFAGLVADVLCRTPKMEPRLKMRRPPRADVNPAHRVGHRMHGSLIPGAKTTKAKRPDDKPKA